MAIAAVRVVMATARMMATVMEEEMAIEVAYSLLTTNIGTHENISAGEVRD